MNKVTLKNLTISAIIILIIKYILEKLFIKGILLSFLTFIISLIIFAIINKAPKNKQ